MDSIIDSQLSERHAMATPQLPANFHVLNHPVLLHKLTLIRNEGCSTDKYHRVVREISSLMAYEVTCDLELSETPVVTCDIPQDPDYKPKIEMMPSLSSNSLTVVPILRAGLAMAEGFLDTLPACRTGHIGIHRDEKSRKLIEYVVALPGTDDGLYFIVDPVISTGDTAVKCIDIVKSGQGAESHIKYVSIVSSHQAAQRLSSAYPGVSFYCVSVDVKLVAGRYVSPGIGDAADRLFGIL